MIFRKDEWALRRTDWRYDGSWQSESGRGVDFQSPVLWQTAVLFDEAPRRGFMTIEFLLEGLSLGE